MQNTATTKILVNRHIEARISNFWSKEPKKVNFTLANIPATVSLDNNGKPIHDPRLPADEEKYLTDNLVNPIAELVSSFKTVNGLTQPHIILQFGQNNAAKAQEAKNDTVTL